MKILSKTYKLPLTILIFLFLLAILPLLILVSRQRQDLRPKALTGNANLCFAAGEVMGSDCQNPISLEVTQGSDLSILSYLTLTRPELRVSGVDLQILYDKDILEVVSVTPQVSDAGPFTNIISIAKDINIDSTYNAIRIVEVAVLPDEKLARGSAAVSLIKFRAKKEGKATIKYHDENSTMQIVGIDTSETN